jgi:hypothetical protein
MAFGKKETGMVNISAPNIQEVQINIEGTAPYVQCKFSEKAKQTMLLDMSTEKADKKGKKASRKVRDYDQEYLDSQHISDDGWVGIPCTAFKSAMVRAASAVGEEMTKFKMALFVDPDGFDKEDGTPLVRIYSKNGSEMLQSDVRIGMGTTNIVTRAMWREWTAQVKVSYDADMMSHESAFNLMARAGQQVGVGCGRPFSKSSVGMGWGTFGIANAKKVGAK